MVGTVGFQLSIILSHEPLADTRACAIDSATSGNDDVGRDSYDCDEGSDGGRNDISRALQGRHAVGTGRARGACMDADPAICSTPNDDECISQSVKNGKRTF